jgi:NDP-sugar pyrophosphorylase family protein
VERRVISDFQTGSEVFGVIPAAGYANRLQPLGGSKEVVPVGGRPVMDYVIDRMQLAGCSKLRVVTRPEKSDVIEHAGRRGATIVEGRPKSVAESLRLGLEGLRPGDVVLFGFPDTVWEPADGFRQLLARIEQGAEVVLGLFRSSELERSDVVVLGDSEVVLSVAVKPTAPRAETIWGCAAARVGSLRGLEAHSEPGNFFDALAGQGRVRGVLLHGPYADIGTRQALRESAALAGPQ